MLNSSPLPRCTIVYLAAHQLKDILAATLWTVACQASPIHHQLSEFTQTHVHFVGDAIQPSHPLSSPSPPTLNLSHHKGLFK